MEPFPMFPLFIPLADKPVVLIGGGSVSARRVKTLLAFGARITVVSPTLHPALRAWTEAGEIHWEARAYRTGDLDGAVLAVAATDVRTVNHAVSAEAHLRGIPASIADRREESSFYFPAVARGGGVVAGIVSENGGAHRTVRKTAEKIRGMLDAAENHPGGQPGKPACRDTGANRHRCHPKD